MRTYTYDPSLVTITIDGVYLTGFAEDSMIEAEKNENSIEPVPGIDSLVHYSKIGDRTGTVTLSLMNTSPSLPMIRELARTQQEFDLAIVDMNEVGQNIVANNCVILKDADINITKEVDAVEIEIFVPYMY